MGQRVDGQRRRARARRRRSRDVTGIRTSARRSNVAAAAGSILEHERLHLRRALELHGVVAVGRLAGGPWST